MCARAVCPGLLRDDCVGWARELERITPTAVFSAVDGRGNDRPDARVTVDGDVAARLDGAATTLDPGEHVVRCELAGEAPIDMHVVLHEAEHDRPVRCAFPPHGARGSAPTTASSTAPPGAARPVPASVWMLGGVGVVALGAWGWFGGSALVWGHPSVPTLHECQPTCPTADRDSVHTELVAADVAGGVALVALGAAAYLFLTRGPVVVPTRDGLLAGWLLAF